VLLEKSIRPKRGDLITFYALQLQLKSSDLELQRQSCKLYSATNNLERFAKQK
jgi:hypothetical protein